MLKKFIGLNQSYNEINLKLEQLRALDNNIPINVLLAKKKPIGVDTKEDLNLIETIIRENNE